MTNSNEAKEVLATQAKMIQKLLCDKKNLLEACREAHDAIMSGNEKLEQRAIKKLVKAITEAQ